LDSLDLQIEPGEIFGGLWPEQGGEDCDLAGMPPEGAGRPGRAIHLLDRGIVANPNYWRLCEDLGFI
jgi:hypothetical protein